MLVTLARFLDPWEAYIVQARLQADGIPATVAFAHHAIVNWPMAVALGGTAVQVPSGCLTQASKILSQYQTGALESELLEVIGSQREHCPGCGSMNLRQTMQLRQRIVAAAVVLLFAPFPAKRCTFLCNDCGSTWEWGQGDG